MCKKPYTFTHIFKKTILLAIHAKRSVLLQAKGYMVIGEFGCAGWNTNSFLVSLEV